MEQWIEMKGGGRLGLRQLGGRVQLEARREGCTDGLYKVWLTGEPGGRWLLGTLAPVGGTFEVSRTVSVRELSVAGCWPVTGGEAVCVFPFSGVGAWQCEGQPGRLIRDRELGRGLPGPMLFCRCADGFRLAHPFRTDRPMVLTGLFCLARTGVIDGSPHLIWEFDGEGMPRLPYGGGKSGAE